MTRSRIALVASLVLAVLVTAGLSGCGRANSPSGETELHLAGNRILVIAPHPDDETLAAGGAVALAREKGYDVTVVFVTCGDGFWAAVDEATGRQAGAPVTPEDLPAPQKMRAYGLRRVAESRKALRALGVPAKNTYFLGFPDGATNRLLQENPGRGARIAGVNGATNVPYPFAYRPGAPYTDAELLRELESLVRTSRPTTVLLPAASDRHRDHWATAAFGQMALAETGYHGVTLSYLVHRRGYPQLRGMRIDASLSPPRSLASAGGSWLTLPLSDEALARKRAAFSAYRTQIEAVGPTISSFVRTNELFVRDTPPTLGSQALALPDAAGGLVARTHAAADLTGLEVSRNADGDSLSLGVRTRGATSRAVTYVLHARTFDASAPVRAWDAAVLGGRVSPLELPGMSAAGTGALAHPSADTLQIALPRDWQGSSAWLLVGADTVVDGRTVDHAAWRLVRLTPAEKPAKAPDAPAGRARAVPAGAPPRNASTPRF
jgi:N-acetyl-1-D-myo-inositol-2-amino-2-deoxy-alpha-D-glucopyranoside deacetylase